MGEVVLNLISNAFKFTFEVKSQLTRRATSIRAPKSPFATPVRAFPPADLAASFRALPPCGKRSPDARIEGSGIGLALVQELVRLHGGDIRVEVASGRGTAFTVSVPFGVDHLPLGSDRSRAGRAGHQRAG